MSVLSYVVLLVLAPVLVRFVDKAYVATKETEMFKDLSDFDTEPTKK